MVFSFTRRVVYRSFFTVKISILKNEVEIKKEIKIEIILIIEYVRRRYTKVVNDMTVGTTFV